MPFWEVYVEFHLHYAAWDKKTQNAVISHKELFPRTRQTIILQQLVWPPRGPEVTLAVGFTILFFNKSSQRTEFANQNSKCLPVCLYLSLWLFFFFFGKVFEITLFRWVPCVLSIRGIPIQRVLKQQCLGCLSGANQSEKTFKKQSLTYLAARQPFRSPTAPWVAWQWKQ